MRTLLSLLTALFLSGSICGQVKFNLTYQPETGRYTVSILPEVSWPAPKNQVGSAQVVLRVASDIDFIPGITSLVPDAVWADNAYVEQTAAAPGYTFVCIALVSGRTDKITFNEGEEVPLFSFVNAGGDCAGAVELLPNDDPMVVAVVAEGFNITQHIGVLGARGNAYSGIINGTTDCGATSGNHEAGAVLIETVQVSPVPASEQVLIRWHMPVDNDDRVEMVMVDQLGREEYREAVGSIKGEHALLIPVKNWQSGIYRLYFQFGSGRRTQSWNVVVLH